MEYCSILCSPTEQNLIDLLEAVQKDFTRKISKYQVYDEELGMPKCNTPYSERLKDLKLYSLERRRERMQILYIYKIILHAVPNPGFQWNYCPRNKIQVTPKVSNTRGWAHSLRNSSFAAMGPKLFNSLPLELRELPDLDKTIKQNIESFKRMVDKYLLIIPDLPGTANSILHHQTINYGFNITNNVTNNASNSNNDNSNNNTINSNNNNSNNNHSNGIINTSNIRRRRRSRNNYGRLTTQLNSPFVSRWDTTST